MRARGLELNLVHGGHVGAADIAARNTELRKLDLLPSGGRGLHAPKITAEHAAYMLLGLASVVAADAGTTAKSYAQFVESGTGHETLIASLSALLSSARLAGQIDEVRFCRTRKWAIIVSADGHRRIYRPKKSAGYGKKDDLTGGREEYVIGGGMFHQIAIDLEHDQGFPGAE